MEIDHTDDLCGRKDIVIRRRGLPDDPSSPVISVRVPYTMVKKLDKIAAAIDRPRAWVCLRALRQYLAGEGAEILGVQEGIAQLDGGESAPLDDIMARLEELVAKAEAKRTPG